MLDFFMYLAATLASGSSTASTIPQPEDVVDHTRDDLMPLSKIFVEEFFELPLFTVVLRCVAQLCGFDNAPNVFIQSDGLSQDDKKNIRFMLHVCFAHFLE